MNIDHVTCRPRPKPTAFFKGKLEIVIEFAIEFPVEIGIYCSTTLGLCRYFFQRDENRSSRVHSTIDSCRLQLEFFRTSIARSEKKINHDFNHEFNHDFKQVEHSY